MKTLHTAAVQFTPGPWQYSGPNSREVFDHANCFPVCTVTDRTYYDDSMEANAHLIAASPDLLRACQMFMRWMEQENQDDPVIEELTLQTVSEHIECAIAKATKSTAQAGGE